MSVIDEDALQYVRETRLLIDLYDEWLLEECCPYIGKNIIDIGCGWGNILDRLLERELVVGIDNNIPCINELKGRYKNNPNIELFNYDVTDEQVLSLARYTFDTAISFNVFEHIEHDELAMVNVYRLLIEGGRFILVVPAHDLLYGSMDTSIGHYRRYTKHAAKMKLENAGFRVVHQKYINMLGALGWFVSGRFLRRRVPPGGQLKIINKLVPIIRTVESNRDTPFGITLLSVAEK